MPPPSYPLKSSFPFGSSTVRIVEGDILTPLVDIDDAALVSSDDNYLTMHSGLSKSLRGVLGDVYVHEIQAKCPVEAGTVICTDLVELVKARGGQSCDLPPFIKYIFHAAVIDYDEGDRPIDEVVGQATASCLNRAEDLGLTSILFPAMGAGGGGVDEMRKSAHAICQAIKNYLGQERSIKNVVIVLHKPGGAGSPHDPDRMARLQAFKAEANLVLDIPYNPLQPGRQARDLFGREELLRCLKDIITDKEPRKKHVLVLGGPKTGKWSLIDQLYLESQKDAEIKGDGLFFVKVTFGKIYENTSLAFIYRKFLNAMSRFEKSPDLRGEILAQYANEQINCAGFTAFLEAHKDRYRRVIFLIDELPNLLELKLDDNPPDDDVRSFWKDLDQLEKWVRFCFTLRNDSQYAELALRLERFTHNFKERIEEVWVPSLDEPELKTWVDQLYNRYIQSGGETPAQMYDFFQAEAGLHPFLVSLARFALVQRIQHERIDHPERPFDPTNPVQLARLIDDAREAIEKPRRDFFVSLLEAAERPEKVNLLNLAKATLLEGQTQSLIASLLVGDLNAESRLEQLQSEGDPREFLDPAVMRRLELRCYVVHASDGKWQFVCAPLAAFILEELGGMGRMEERPSDIVISILGAGRKGIRTLLRSRGARILTADKLLTNAIRTEFMEGYDQFIDRVIRSRSTETQDLAFRSAEEIGNFILTQFTTIGIKRYLQNPPPDCTVSFTVDDAFKDIPWELMLEATYAGEIPFRVGRSIIDQECSQNVRPPVRGSNQIKSLLIGDPTGDLPEAAEEIRVLSETFRNDGRFDAPDLLVGKSECTRMHILSSLSTGRYGLVHYSGHSQFKGTQSAWQVADGDLTTDMLTNAIQMAPPVLVFSSSCSSAAVAKARLSHFEGQTFDLPGAFLLAGVEAYIGSLWEVDSQAARLFVEKFYACFLNADINLGECMRQAKWSLKQEQRQEYNDWLAFILYGDPHVRSQELYPALKLRNQ